MAAHPSSRPAVSLPWLQVLCSSDQEGKRTPGGRIIMALNGGMVLTAFRLLSHPTWNGCHLSGQDLSKTLV